MFQKFTKGVCLYDQIYDFFENKFSKYQCGFRKSFNTQNALLSMVEKMLLVRDKKEVCGTILSKLFDCISHDLLIAKLNASGLDQNGLNVIHNYLSGRSRKNKVSSSFSDLLDILHGVPQGAILGPLLFNKSLSE